MAVVDAGVSARAGWTMAAVAAAFLEGGARLLQVRAKTMASGTFLDVAMAVVGRARQVGATVIVNDRADVARLSGADGVHVGQDDLTPRDARVVAGPAALVGLSTHTIVQLCDALERTGPNAPSYVAVGPVFGTATKATGYEASGLSFVREAAARAGRAGIPLVAIGGISLETAADVIGAGAASVAVIGDLMVTGDPAGRVRAYLERLTV